VTIFWKVVSKSFKKSFNKTAKIEKSKKKTKSFFFKIVTRDFLNGALPFERGDTSGVNVKKLFPFVADDKA
jgi:hypothetical protein